MSGTPKDIDEALVMAIEREEKANAFYLDLAGKVSDPRLRRLLEGFARDEQGHKARLEAVRTKGRYHGIGTGPFRVSDTLEAVIEPDLPFRGTLRVAVQNEKRAFRLYSGMAAAAEDPEMKGLFNGLASEEAWHALSLEMLCETE